MCKILGLKLLFVQGNREIYHHVGRDCIFFSSISRRQKKQNAMLIKHFEFRVKL